MVGLKKKRCDHRSCRYFSGGYDNRMQCCPDNDATVVTVGTEKVSYGVANFYARMQQAQYESFYAG